MSKCEICGTPNVRKREDVWICSTHYNQYLEYFLVTTEYNKNKLSEEYFDSTNIKDYIEKEKESLSEKISEKIKDMIPKNLDKSVSEKFSPNVFKETKTVKKMMKEFSIDGSEVNVSDILVYLYAKQKSQEEIDRYEKEIESILNKL